MKTTGIDAKPRLPALDDDHWLGEGIRPVKYLKLIAVPTIAKLAADPKWEKIERKLARAALRGLPEPE